MKTLRAHLSLSSPATVLFGERGLTLGEVGDGKLTDDVEEHCVDFAQHAVGTDDLLSQSSRAQFLTSN